MVASTNARLDADAERIAADLPERVGAVLIDGHNPALAYAALTLGVPEVDGEDPFAQLEARPPHPRILDGGSWKEWLTPLLGFVDIAVVSEDFAPPLMARPDGAQVAEFLRGFGITRTVRTRGDRSVQYWWDGASGEVPVDAIPDASTLGAGDAFHGAFAWAIERGGDARPERLIRFASAVAAVSVSSWHEAVAGFPRLSLSWCAAGRWWVTAGYNSPCTSPSGLARYKTLPAGQKYPAPRHTLTARSGVFFPIIPPAPRGA